jgi:hypothetical protein
LSFRIPREKQLGGIAEQFIAEKARKQASSIVLLL